MKKEETYKKNTALKNECDFRSRSVSPKAYLGCDTCRSRRVKSSNKLSDCNSVQEKNKQKKAFPRKDEGEPRTHKAKLTDLCDEDKGRIVELIEELSKFEEKNKELKEKLDELQKEKRDQQDQMLKQASLFLEEKNFYINEINKYKNKLESYESEMSSKLCQWENSVRIKDSKIVYFAKALKKSIKEKNELHQLMNRLKNCLRNSLDSFQKLKAQVTELQTQEQSKKICISVFCQTENQFTPSKENRKLSEPETEEEYFPPCNSMDPNAKSSLDVINDKLENLYRFLRRKKENIPNSQPHKYDIGLSILLKNDNLAKEERTEDINQLIEDVPGVLEGRNNDAENFLKSQKNCSKTLLEVENLLKNIGNPLNAIVNECTQMTENNNVNVSSPKERPKDLVRCSNFLQNKIVQKNNLFKLSEDDQYEEDRILEELFYSDQSLNLGLDSILRLENEYLNDRPFTS